jgi:putative NADH-flavin reductase
LIDFDLGGHEKGNWPMAQAERIAVLGASGRVGRRVVDRALAAGYAVAAQTREAGRLADLADRVEVHAFDPRDQQALARFVAGAHAVVFALGTKPGATTLFSEVTTALVAAMREAGVRRLVAITGVGAGDTRGHGGFLYDRIVFPLFTQKMYRDKDRQEALIADSGLDWTIVRPAPFRDRPAEGPLQVVYEVGPDTVLRRITPDEVAQFVVDQLASDAYLHQRPFIGHP